MSEFLSPTELPDFLKDLTVEQLERLASERGLVVGGSGKEGKVLKKDYVASLSVHMSRFPSHVKVLANYAYHNGGIVGRHGVEWKGNEQRVIPLSAWAQIKADVDDEDAFEVMETLIYAGALDAD